LGQVDHFILFSSLGSLLGQHGQSNYAAANAFLDALAHYRRSQNQTGLSINWGAWAGLGFAATSGGQRTLDHLASQGMDSFTATQGLKILEQLFEQDFSQVAVIPINWSKFSQAQAKAAETAFKRVNPLFTHLLTEINSAQPEKTKEMHQNETSIRKSLLAAEPESRRELLEKHLTKLIAKILKLPPSRIEPDKPLGVWGIDSLMALELRNRLEADLGLTLSATMVWNYPTVVAMIPYLAGKMNLSLEGAAAPTSSNLDTERPTETSEQPVEQVSQLKDVLADIEALSEEEALNTLLSKK
jgi:acyl carrier protein